MFLGEYFAIIFILHVSYYLPETQVKKTGAFVLTVSWRLVVPRTAEDVDNALSFSLRAVPESMHAVSGASRHSPPASTIHAR